MVRMTDLQLSRPDALLAGDERGTGPIVGYSHGMFLSRAGDDRSGLIDWTPLTGSHRLVRYDARAHGASTGRPVPEDYRWSQLAGDLLAVADAVSDGPVDWMGASMGCGSLLWAATVAPQRFRRLVLVIPPTIGETRAATAGVYRAGAETIERDGIAAWVATLRQFATPAIFDDVPGYEIPIEVGEPLLPSVLRGAALSDLPDASALGALTLPALILSWDTDPVHPVSTAEYLARTLPDARLHVSQTSADVRTWADRAGEFLDG
jgi:pimeloyl-ACP methyl ester carboxylesterase